MKNNATPSTEMLGLDLIRKEALEFAEIGLYRYKFDGTLVYADEVAIGILEIQDNNLTPDSVIGRNVSDFIVYTGPEGALREATKEHGRVRNFVYKFQTLGGKVKWALHDSYIVVDPITGEEEIQAIVRDITDLKYAEIEIKKLNEELEKRVHERTEQLQDVNEVLSYRTIELEAANRELESFAYSISHDLRAPLRSIDGFSQALIEDYTDKLDDTGKDYLRRVRISAQRMGQLIDDLLRLSRVSRTSMHRNDVDLSEIARQVAAELQATEPENRAEFIIPDGIVTEGDPQLLQIAMENLLSNAWKFASKREHPVIEFGVKQEGDKTVYFVRDNGAGFDMTFAGKLFLPFQRLHTADEFPGTGIGLAIVQRIIRRHGGTIRAEGAVDEGATFYFTL